ncbi:MULTISPECIES: hypothetical protein [unclassified Sporosarcina]|uniref:hypothetical protein n=1 Tax=unclassified Sporosarcina TaxID=2647733 RepID=UPI00117A791D|nr:MULTISPECIES: hypothetical protein [unclassified Sporosarcina]
MRTFLHDIRKPMNVPRSRKIISSISLLIIGVILGVLSKVLDETASNSLPFYLEMLDLGNFFSRIGIWIFISVLISLYSKSPMRSAINVFLFFVGMVGSYYLYTIEIAGFFPKSYMMIWIAMTLISPFLAFVCWYAKGTGTISVILSSVILLMISRQAFAFGFWYFDIRYNLEFLLFIVAIFILYKSPKQLVKVVTIGMLLFFLTAQINLLWGML